jgi:predicted oxidoreductase
MDTAPPGTPATSASEETRDRVREVTHGHGTAGHAGDERQRGDCVTDTDVVVVGAGLAGLVAAAELAEAGRRVVLLEQEPEQSLGGQAWWSFGGLFLVDSPEQRRLRVRDSLELARQDWLGTASFDRPEDHWPRQWAEAYLQFAAGEKRAWLREQGIGFFPVVGWAERGGYTATGHGNSVPRFHIVWGTGPGIVAPFARRVRAAADRGVLQLRFRHRVDELVVTDGAVTGVRGTVLEPSGVARGEASSRTPVGGFEVSAQAVVVTSGGIGGNHDLVRQNWPARLGPAPQRLLSGVPAHVDGRMLQTTEAAGANLINRDRMWHYTEGIANHSPVWQRHGIRILPGPSSLWLDATGKRLPVPLFPGFDTLGTLAHIGQTGHEHTWFVATHKIVEKEFALSGSEQNPDLTGKDVKLLLGRVRAGVAAPVQAFLDRGEDFVVARTLPELVAGMNRVTGGTPELRLEDVEREVVARDREVAHPFTKDLQVTAIRGARNYLGDKLIRVAPPHRLLDPEAGPLVAVRLNLITRKTLGGLETDLSGRVLRAGGAVFPGLYAAGEAAGFGGGGMHGYRSLEGTFLGGCLFSGRTAGRALAAAL